MKKSDVTIGVYETFEPGNLMIVDFMSYYKDNDLFVDFPTGTRDIGRVSIKRNRDHLWYHADWKWLIPVIEKIEAINDPWHGHFGVHIISNSCTIQSTRLRPDEAIKEGQEPRYFASYTEVYKLIAVWKAVVDFIEWYDSRPSGDLPYAIKLEDDKMAHLTLRWELDKFRFGYKCNDEDGFRMCITFDDRKESNIESAKEILADNILKKKIPKKKQYFQTIPKS